MRRRRARRQDEILIRAVQVTSFRTRVSLHPGTDEPLIESSAWIELGGMLDEAIAGVRDIVISVHGKDNLSPGPLRPVCVGAMIQIRPRVSAVVSLLHREFDRAWQMAVTGELKHASMTFIKPAYNKARIINISFSNEPEE